MSAELVYRVRAEGSELLRKIQDSVRGTNEEVKKGAASLKQFDAAMGQAASGSSKLAASLGGASNSMAGAVIKADLLASAIGRVTSFAKEYSVEAAKYAARTETLGVVMDRLAKVNNLSQGAVRGTAEALKAQGITTQESISVINRMIFAQLDLKKATDLARLAQNAAVIAGQNSSEALSGIINGIVTRNTETLRTYGIIVDFEPAFTAAARKIGRALTEGEKNQIAFNEALSQNVKIAGAYEASMLTAGKQLTSLSRYADEAKQSIGEGLVPVLSLAVTGMSSLAKWAKDSGDGVSSLVAAVTAGGSAWAILRLLGAGGPVGALAGGVAALAAPLLLPSSQDVALDNARGAVGAIIKQRADLNAKLAAGKPDDAARIRAEFEGTERALDSIKEVLASQLAAFAKKRVGQLEVIGSRKDDAGHLEPVYGRPQSLGDLLSDRDLGSGIRLSRAEQIAVASRQADTSGATFNQSAFDAQQKAALAADFAKKATDVEKAIQNYINGSFEAALDGIEKIRFEGKVEEKKAVTADQLRRIREATERKVAAYLTDTFGTVKVGESDIDKANPAIRRTSPSLFTAREQLRGIQAGLGTFVASPEANTGLAAADAAYGKGLADKLKTAGEQREQLAARERDHRLRMIELTAGPGGELAAARKVAELRLASAQNELERQEARVQLEERVAQLAQERLRKYEETAGRVYDALKQSGGGGLRDFVRGQGDILARQVFVNASSGIFQQLGGTLGKVGEASGLGPLLRGTIFDPANAQPIDKNTLALTRVGASLDNLTGAITGVPAVLGGDGAYSLPGGVLQGGTGITQSFAKLLGGGGGSKFDSNAFAATFFDQAPAAGAGRNRLAGSIGAAALGGYGVYAGLRQGGTGGAFTAAGGALSIASAIPGPQQPFLQGAALVVGFLGSLFGGGKAQAYEDKQNAALNAARYAAPTGRDVIGDRYGNAIDYDYRGKVRVIERPVYVEVNTMDAKSFNDNRQLIAGAVREAMREGSDLTDTVRAVTHLP